MTCPLNNTSFSLLQVGMNGAPPVPWEVILPTHSEGALGWKGLSRA